MSAVTFLRFATKRPAWFDRAACRGATPALWYPDAGESGGRSKDTDATRVCKDCPVRADCLQMALDTHEQHGVWGGLSPKARRRYGRQVLAGLLEDGAA